MENKIPVYSGVEVKGGVHVSGASSFFDEVAISGVLKADNVDAGVVNVSEHIVIDCPKYTQVETPEEALVRTGYSTFKINAQTAVGVPSLGAYYAQWTITLTQYSDNLTNNSFQVVVYGENGKPLLVTNKEITYNKDTHKLKVVVYRDTAVSGNCYCNVKYRYSMMQDTKVSGTMIIGDKNEGLVYESAGKTTKLIFDTPTSDVEIKIPSVVSGKVLIINDCNTELTKITSLNSELEQKYKEVLDTVACCKFKSNNANVTVTYQVYAGDTGTGLIPNYGSAGFTTDKFEIPEKKQWLIVNNNSILLSSQTINETVDIEFMQGGSQSVKITGVVRLYCDYGKLYIEDNLQTDVGSIGRTSQDMSGTVSILI